MWFARPTTRDPVVYLHEAIDAKRLDPALQLCKLVSHDRAALRHKILVDTPDVDSNDLANREKLFRILPVADVVLYVGSQEKYHDQLGWDLFLEQKKRRAFAFVLNKWDRCQTPGAGARARTSDVEAPAAVDVLDFDRKLVEGKSQDGEGRQSLRGIAESFAARLLLG